MGTKSMDVCYIICSVMCYVEIQMENSFVYVDVRNEVKSFCMHYDEADYPLTYNASMVRLHRYYVQYYSIHHKEKGGRV